MNAIYDRGEAIARLGGDASLFASVAELFVADVENYRASLSDALAKGDAADLRRAAHTVKSVLATFSYEVGREQASALEQAAAVGDLKKAANLVAATDAAIVRLAEALRSGG